MLAVGLGTGLLPSCTKPLQEPKLSKLYKNKSPHLGTMCYNEWNYDISVMVYDLT